MDGFLRLRLDGYPAGYYREADRPFSSALARSFTVLDRSFCSILGPTFPNRLFMHAAQTDRLDDALTVTTLVTIWDRLAAAGVSHAYYFSNVPFLALWPRVSADLALVLAVSDRRGARSVASGLVRRSTFHHH
jgi:phospholipase C